MTQPDPELSLDRSASEAVAQKKSEAAAQEIKRLVAEIDRHDHLYYVKDAPEVSDLEYDALYRRLQELEKAHPELRAPDSPTQRVGAEPLAELPSAEHGAPMLSLDSSYELGDVRRFDERVRKELDSTGATDPIRYVLEPKLDGASLELVYEDGLLVRATTRGNGYVGEVVTENARTIRSIPLRLLDVEKQPPPRFLSVRGEAIMRLSEFQYLNHSRRRKGRPEYKNPRNVTSGALRQLDSRVVARRPLQVFAFDVLHMEGGPPLPTDRRTLSAMKAWGFQIPERVKTAGSVEEIADYYSDFDERRDDLDYEIDGIVIKVDELALRPPLGETSHHPRWAMALKFRPRRVAAVIRAIDTQIGRTGVVTPVARLWPVKVSGVTVTNVTLHNREELERKGVREGDAVWVQRAGDVIPQILGRVKRGAPFSMPAQCESCGTELVERGPLTVCPNHFGCRAQLEARIVHFASRSALDIEGLGAKTVEQLVERGLAQELADLFDLKREHVAKLDGFGQLSAAKLIRAIREPRVSDLPAGWRSVTLHPVARAALQGRKQVKLERFLVGLGIPEVGTTVARDLAAHFRGFSSLRQATREQLAELHGVGEKMASAIREFFDNEHVKHGLDRLLRKGFDFVPPPEPAPAADADHALASRIAGKTFVITGTFESISRSKLKEHLRTQGARVTGSVTAKTDYLGFGDKPGSKLAKAQELGVKVLGGEEFLEFIHWRAESDAAETDAAESAATPPHATQPAAKEPNATESAAPEPAAAE